MVSGKEKEDLRSRLIAAGADAAGFASAAEVAEECRRDLEEWLREGKNAGMEYMARNNELRADPRTLLEGARTVISLAFSYYPQSTAGLPPGIAYYALGKDYHNALRKVIKPMLREYMDPLGARWRICIDSAPVAEKYWANQAGIASIGRNSLAIVKGVGSFVVLAEVLTTLEIEPDHPAPRNCLKCGLCEKRCPAGAISGAHVDSRRCISYLTIEHRGEWDHEPPHGSIFGCDICQRCCPLNSSPRPARLPAFAPGEAVRELTAEKLSAITEEQFNSLFAGSPLRRAGLSSLLRNLRLCK